MFDIEKGPGHHLIDAIPKDIEDLGDKSVDVQEMKVDVVDAVDAVDAATIVTFLSFGILALLSFVLTFVVLPFVQDKF
jgi:hypothetical protein